MKTLAAIEADLEALERSAKGWIEKINLKAKRRPWPFAAGAFVLGFFLALVLSSAA